MRIVELYSHLNGLEFLQVHKPGLWSEIQNVIESVDANACRTKVSKEVRTLGNVLYSPIDMNRAMDHAFSQLGWKESRTSYWVTSDARLIRKTMNMSAAQQKAEIDGAGLTPIRVLQSNGFRKRSSRVRSPIW